MAAHLITRTDPATSATWWRTAVVYQIYPRSFADSTGDGIGDINGIRSRIGYLADLGVDAIWISPWYPSPMKDAGYDVSDFRDIDPVFGTLDDAQSLLDEAHAAGIRVLIDIVPNHVSDAHPWFRAALAAGPGSPQRARFVFRDGRGATGDLPPNDWMSTFGGSAWTRTLNPDGTPGQWYLHLFTPHQPDVNWACQDVVADFEATLRFWFDRGVDGFRIDVAHGLVKDEALADIGAMAFPLPDDTAAGIDHPHWDRPGVHDIYRSWRTIADSYDPPRIFVGEVWVGRPHRLAAYVRPDELHTAFNFEFLNAAWMPTRLRAVIDATLSTHAEVGAPSTWVLENHDVPRVVSRDARPQERLSSKIEIDELLRLPADFDLGRRRARAHALVLLGLPGVAYVYEGQELGLPEVEDLPASAIQDPVFFQTRGLSRGRDGCRVPIPWTGDPDGYGFQPAHAEAAPWLPQPAQWADLSVEAQQDDPTSTLNLYRRALRLRTSLPELRDGDFAWVEGAGFAFRRGEDIECRVNFDAAPVALPQDAEVLVASDVLVDGMLPTDTAVWIRRDRAATGD